MKREIIEFDSKIENITFVRSFLRTLGNTYRLSRNLIYKVELAVEEAVTNIIRHGYPDKQPGKIRLEIVLRHFSLTVVVIDHGREFDPRQVGNPDLNQYVQVGKIGGLGVIMIKKLIDVIDYRVTDRGNELYLIKYRKNVSFYNLYHLILSIQQFLRRLFPSRKNGINHPPPAQ